MTLTLPPFNETVVLSLLAEHGELYGLQLVGLSDNALKRGTIYVTLARMQDKGFVRVLRDKHASEHAGMPRPRYKITAQGERSLRAYQLAREALRPQRIQG